jgi:hypothetical protein
MRHIHGLHCGDDSPTPAVGEYHGSHDTSALLTSSTVRATVCLVLPVFASDAALDGPGKSISARAARAIPGKGLEGACSAVQGWRVAILVVTPKAYMAQHSAHATQSRLALR